jgi:hypothetical protein
MTRVSCVPWCARGTIGLKYGASLALVGVTFKRALLGAHDDPRTRFARCAVEHSETRGRSSTGDGVAGIEQEWSGDAAVAVEIRKPTDA